MNDRVHERKTSTPWKILIGDDDEDVHITTEMALRRVRFRDRSLEFIHAYSGSETLTKLRENPDTAVILIDVVMESDDAGLRTVRRIRENGFKLVRIIVRTGYSGKAPEQQVIVDYDIHDYKEKTGLLVDKLVVSIISALRAYGDLLALESHRRGLMSVLETVSWFDLNAVQRYVSGILSEFCEIARIDSGRVAMISRPSTPLDGPPTMLATLGDWQRASESLEVADLPTAVLDLVSITFAAKHTMSGSDGQALFFSNRGIDLVVFAEGANALEQADEVLLEVFLVTVCQAISNQYSFAEVLHDRDAVLRVLALHAERWNPRASVELNQLSWWVCALSARLHATLVFPEEIDDRFMRDIGVAAMLHDLGNDSVSTSLLNKTSGYESEERSKMQAHVAQGVGALDAILGVDHNLGALRLAREIIACHHEHFDGSGYPHGLRGEEIPLSARLVAVADAYISMTSSRPHRTPLDASDASACIQSEKGRQFDPRVVQAFLEVVESSLEK